MLYEVITLQWHVLPEGHQVFLVEDAGAGAERDGAVVVAPVGILRQHRYPEDQGGVVGRRLRGDGIQEVPVSYNFV